MLYDCRAERGTRTRAPPVVKYCCRQGVGGQWDGDPHQLSASACQKARSIKKIHYINALQLQVKLILVAVTGLGMFSVCLWDFKTRYIFCIAAREGFKGKTRERFFSNAWLFSACQCKRKHVYLVFEYRN